MTSTIVRCWKKSRRTPPRAAAARRMAWSLVAACLWAGAAIAREAAVENHQQLGVALARAGAGDVIVLRAGDWPNTPLVVPRGGSKAQPLVIRAERPGATVLGGLSFVRIEAPYVVVDGIAFHRGAIEEGAVVTFASHHGVLRNVAIIDYNPPAFDTQYYWVFFAGDHNTVDRCYFKGKNHHGPVVGNAREGSRHNTVSRSHFKNIPYRAANGREIIRVWGFGQNDELGQDGAFFTIEDNLFDRADGEGSETVSLKSNRNVVRGNTILATRGGINIRRGSYNTVTGNVVLGRGVDHAHGLRVSGQHNVVTDNFVSGCDVGICISAGEYAKKAITPAYKPHPAEEGSAKSRTAWYPQVVSLTLTGNVVVGNTKEDLEIGRSYLEDWPAAQMVLLPEDCLIENNRFVRPDGGNAVTGILPKSEAPFGQFMFRPNRYAGNVVLGGKVKFESAAAGFDVRPLPRDWDPGQEQPRRQPLTPSDVGPPWVVALREAGTFVVEDVAAVPAAAAAETREQKKLRKARQKAGDAATP